MLESNLRLAIALLVRFQRWGLRHLVLAPGSRSAPLAVAAGLLEAEGLVALHPSIDERSGAFLALGLARAEGRPAAVVTTSGSAVANLLPAAVEADHGTLPLLLLTADRPSRLKGCGANQAVNQETFLQPSCRLVREASPAGLATMAPEAVQALADAAWNASLGMPAGPVHLNLPFDEPLHAGAGLVAQLRQEFCQLLRYPSAGPPTAPTATASAPAAAAPDPVLDPTRPGVIVAGPWRGRRADWQAWLDSLRSWQQRTGWPLLADPLSGLRGDPHLEILSAYDLFLEAPELPRPEQVLRLGPLPASRRLQRWLEGLDAVQVLVTEGEPRPLDPLRQVRAQCSSGLIAWRHRQREAEGAAVVAEPSPASRALAAAWRRVNADTGEVLVAWAAQEQAISEPLLAHRLSTLLPAGLPVMLANSSPVRDWETFAAPGAPHRPFAGFRGASGIDGTLSEACGLAIGWGEAVLVSGDLSLLHDSNGWLWSRQLRHHGARLTVLLLDNAGGGIFEQLPIRPDPGDAFDFERLFAMAQSVDPLALAAAHGVPGQAVPSLDALEPALAWARSHPLALLQVRTDRRADHARRLDLRARVTAALGG